MSVRVTPIDVFMDIPEWFYIISQSSGLVLEETGNDDNDGRPVPRALVVNKPSFRDGQLWKWQEDSIVNKRNRAIDRGGPINPDSWDDGSDACGFPADKENTNQKWKFEKNRIIYKHDHSFEIALEVKDARAIPGTKVFGSHSGRKQEQLWNIEYTNQGPMYKSPEIEILPQSFEVDEGLTASFKCRVIAGFPKPTITWSRYGGRNFTENITDDGNGILTIVNAGHAEAGVYICIAENGVRATKATATLSILGPSPQPSMPQRWFFIQSRYNGLVLEETGEEQKLLVNQKYGRDGQLWRWQENSLISKNNRAIDFKGQLDSGYMIGFKPHRGDNQIWKFENNKIVGLGPLLTNFALEVKDYHVVLSGIEEKQEKQSWILCPTNQVCPPS